MYNVNLASNLLNQHFDTFCLEIFFQNTPLSPNEFSAKTDVFTEPFKINIGLVSYQLTLNLIRCNAYITFCILTFLSFTTIQS